MLVVLKTAFCCMPTKAFQGGLLSCDWKLVSLNEEERKPKTQIFLRETMPWPLRARSGAAEHWPCMNVCEDWEVRWNFHWQDMIRSPHQRRLQPEACTYLHFPKHLETLVISGAPHPTNLQPLSQRHCISNTLKAQQGSWSTIVPPSAAAF